MKNILNKIKLRNIYIYVSNRCNLKCDYCYFKYKNNKYSLGLREVEAFLDLLKSYDKRDKLHFIISGGEPVLEWDLLKKIITYIRLNFNTNPGHIQTNGTLLDRRKLLFLKQYRFGVEFGIDGGFMVNLKHRKGINKLSFDILKNNIATAVSLGLNAFATMTVHPKEIEKMESSFKYLLNMNLKSIDITPAAFMAWNKRAVERFKVKYCNIVASTLSSRNNHISIDEDLFLLDTTFDLSLEYPGIVLLGDVYLCLAKEEKDRVSIMRFNSDNFSFNNQNVAFFLKELRDFLKLNKRMITYRDIVNLNFRIIQKISVNLSNIEPVIILMNFIKLQNQKLILGLKQGTSFNNHV